MKMYENLNKRTIVDETTEAIISGITTGKYKVGGKLPNEYELIDELKVSRTSLRETIKILCAMGVLEIRRGDGTYVCSQMTPSVFDHVIYNLISTMSTGDELVELREMLDELTICTAISKITEEELAMLRNNIKLMTAAYEEKKLEEFKNLDYEFHMILIDACKNIFYSRIVKGVYTIYVKSMDENVNRESYDTKAIFYHQQILKCIENKQITLVKDIVSESLSTWKQIIKNRRQTSDNI